MVDGAVGEEKWADDCWKTPIAHCLNCGYEVDAASCSPLDPEPRGPQENDVSICLKCSHIAIYKADRTLRPATDAEMDEVASDPDTQVILQAMGIIRKRGRWKRHGA